jgi:hypothetical protein
VNRYTTTASTTPSTACASCPGQCSGLGIPVWVAGFYGHRPPLRRAARYQGFIPANLDRSDQLAEIVAGVTAERRAAGIPMTQPYNIVAALPPAPTPRHTPR